MLAVYFKGNNIISLREIEKPHPQGRNVIVRIKSASICGTDRENLEGSGQSTIPGHENAGEVVEIDKPVWLEKGSRVAINCHVTCRRCEHCLKGDFYFCKDLSVLGFDRDGGYAEYISVPEKCCMPLPDDISYETGSLLVDMLGTPFRAIKRAELLPGHHIAIWGAGPIGLGALIIASQYGIHTSVIDMNEYRLNMAESLGAELTINPSRDNVYDILNDWTRERGVDTAFDCVGSEKTSQQGLEALKKRGRLVVVGVSHKLTLNPWEDLICRELTILGTRNFIASEFEEMISLVRSGLPVEQIVTHRFPLAKAEDAFFLFRSGKCGKILLTA